MTYENTLEYARKRDAEDVLSKFKERFYIQKDTIYMDGNSLGLASKDAEECVLKAIEDWKVYGIDVWSHEDTNYFLYQDKLGAMIAPLINAKPEEVTVGNSTTVNVHQAVATFYKPTKDCHKIIMDELNFPTDIYAVRSMIKLHGYDPEDSLILIKSDDGKFLDEDKIIAAMNDDVSMILLPSVLYRSAQLLDMEKVTKAAHEKGIIIGWDLCHSIGAIPHDFKAIQPDFAVFCDYKYLNGGPGAIAGLYINEKHFGLDPGLAGWHGNRKDTQFELNIEFESANYAGGWQIGTQPVFSMAPIEGSMRIFKEAGIENIRKKSLDLTRYLMYLVDENLSEYGFSFGNPDDDRVRGGHVALEHEEAIRICAALKDNKVIPDFRFPNVIRLAPVALYISYEDVFEMVRRLKKIMDNKEYEKYEKKIGTVA